jgi:hypothetical protein
MVGSAYRLVCPPSAQDASNMVRRTIAKCTRHAPNRAIGPGGESWVSLRSSGRGLPVLRPAWRRGSPPILDTAATWSPDVGALHVVQERPRHGVSADIPSERSRDKHRDNGSLSENCEPGSEKSAHASDVRMSERGVNPHQSRGTNGTSLSGERCLAFVPPSSIPPPNRSKTRD